MQENFYQINAVIALFFVITYGLLIHALIHHMRQMVRLKYHVDKRAEFDESRVKIVIGSIFLLALLYAAVWVYCLTTLDITKQLDYMKASSLFKAISVSLLVGAYVIYFINNRIKGDINHIKKIVRYQEDPTQKVLVHL